MRGSRQSSRFWPILAVFVAALVGIAAIVGLREIVAVDDDREPATQVPAVVGLATQVGAVVVATSGSPIATPVLLASPRADLCSVAGTPADTRETALTSAEIRLRAGPDITCDTLEFMPEGTEVEMLSEFFIDDAGNIWSRVRRADTGLEGWTAYTLLNVQSLTPTAASD